MADFILTIKEIPFRVHFTVKALFAIKIYFRRIIQLMFSFVGKVLFKNNFYELYENEF